MLGNWINHIDELRGQYLNAKPFEHVIIENFFDNDFCLELEDQFPIPDIENKNWALYKNPLEHKYALNNLDDYNIYKKLFDFLQSNKCIDLFKQITGIENLENDSTLHGAGLHYHPRGGKLDMHLDYSLHPLLKKERRLNLIVYLNRIWFDKWNGDIQLWNREFTQCEKRIYPRFNTAILFKTNDISYHGLPTPITCPENMGRKSIAIYYLSDISEEMQNIRYKATFRPLPSQPVNEKLQKLYDIRGSRRITQEDLNSIYPDWEKDGNGYW